MTSERRNILLMVLMIVAAVLAIVFHPTHKIADDGPAVNLEAMIPKQFGDWKEDEKNVVLLVSPEVEANLNRIYAQTLSKTYINNQTGKRIMLSIAYGKDQRSEMAVHFPEVCYPAQGFEVLVSQLSKLETPDRSIPIRKLETKLRERYEPVTYWITIGDYVSLTGLDRRIKELMYGLNGTIPDGMLFRVSSINMNSDEAFKDQEDFVSELFRSIPLAYRNRLAGKVENLY